MIIELHNKPYNFYSSFLLNIPVGNYPFPSLPFVLMYLLIANLILNYGQYENTVETQNCILFLEKPFGIKLILT
jgi:hypothetical protein